MSSRPGSLGKGARGSGPRERMVPLINGAGATLRWFIEDVWCCFDDDHARPGAPLFCSERRNLDGDAVRVGNETLRSALATAAHLPGWPERVTPHVLRHFCASQLSTATSPSTSSRKFSTIMRVILSS
jgi:integrase/recombinase XerD